MFSLELGKNSAIDAKSTAIQLKAATVDRQDKLMRQLQSLWSPTLALTSAREHLTRLPPTNLAKDPNAIPNNI